MRIIFKTLTGANIVLDDTHAEVKEITDPFGGLSNTSFDLLKPLLYRKLGLSPDFNELVIIFAGNPCSGKTPSDMNVDHDSAVHIVIRPALAPVSPPPSPASAPASTRSALSDLQAREREAEVGRQLFHEIQTEMGADEWISSSPSSQAILMANKRQNRFEKGKVFNGFVLQQQSQHNNEFLQFLDMLRANAKQIPPGTRMQLAVLTAYTDPIEDKYYFDRGERNRSHWTAIDILVGEDGQVSSFVLDAAGTTSYIGIHNRLKEAFPTGHHYIFKRDTITVEKKSTADATKDKVEEKTEVKVRALQTQAPGCRVFAIEHARQLSQIDTETLYGRELPSMSQPNGVIMPKDVKAGSQLTRIFRSMQSWTGLRSLGEGVLKTPIKSKETLEQSALRRSESGLNKTIPIKSQRYKAKKRDFVLQNVASSANIIRILDQRQGFIFLTHPVLFELSNALAATDKKHLHDFMEYFYNELKQSITTTTTTTTFFPDNNPRKKLLVELDSMLDALSLYSTSEESKTKKPLGAYKNELLMFVSALLETAGEASKDKLTEMIRDAIPIFAVTVKPTSS